MSKNKPETIRVNTERAEKNLKKIKESRKGKEFEIIRIDKRTVIEKQIKK